jgi:hypothetical protein
LPKNNQQPYNKRLELSTHNKGLELPKLNKGLELPTLLYLLNLFKINQIRIFGLRLGYCNLNIFEIYYGISTRFDNNNTTDGFSCC